MKRISLRSLFYAALCTLLLSLPSAQADIIINEVMATTAIYVDDQSYDWIELHNNGNEAVSLSGWYLSNDPYQLKRYAFPENTTVKKDAYLIVYCTSHEVENPQPNTLYAGFNLSAEGDAVYLTDPEGNTVSVEFGAQFGNVSCGLPAGSQAFSFLETATPGAANPAEGYTARAAEPVIETAAGFYENSVTVSIAAEEGLEIRYTTDCSVPTRTSPLYTEPLTFSKTTVVRARAFTKDLLGSTTAGSTFFINESFPVPVVSVFTDDQYLFNKKTGLMVKGYSDVNPNYMRNWRYPIHFEYFDENGVRQVSQMGSFKISGKTMRAGKQKSLNIYAHSAYGNDTFDYPFFEDRSYTSYSAILLRYSNSDSSTTRLRDAVVSKLSDGLGLYYQAARPILVFINGQYWGHYNLREKSNKDSLAQWEGITDEDVIRDIDILEATGMQDDYIVKGDNKEWLALMDYCKTHDLHNPEYLEYVLSQIDVDSLFNNAIFSMIIGNFDANNNRMYHFPGQKWKFMLHDVEVAFHDLKQSPVSLFIRNRTQKASSVPHYPLTALLELPEYRQMFLERVAYILENHFLYDIHVEPVFTAYREQLSLILPRHCSWLRNISYSDWNLNMNYIMNNARRRPKTVLNYICQQMKVTAEEKERYFTQTYALLNEHNYN